jgi:HlyD family secretion protein
MDKKKRKRLAIGLIAVFVISIAVIIYQNTRRFYYAGTIESTKIDVPARVASVIASKNINEGDKVEAGKDLFDLECSDIKIASDMASADFVRAEQLYKAGSMPKETYEHTKNKKDDAVLKYSWCNITAPTKGTILDTYKEVGEWVSPGVKLLTLSDLSEVWAYVYVPQTMLAKISLGMKVKSYLPELDMKEFDGVITKINSEAEFTPKNVQTREERTRLVYGVKITFQNREEILKPGMSIEAKL